MVAPFARWRWFVTQTHNCRLLSIATHLCIVVLPIAKIAVFDWVREPSGLYGRVLPSELRLRVVDLTPSMPWMFSTSTSYLDSCLKVCRSAISSKSLDIVFWYRVFLLNSLALSHECILTFSKCVSTKYHLECDLITLSLPLFLLISASCLYP
jgi:hypothetical protein